MKTAFVNIARKNVNTIINNALVPQKNDLVEDEYVGSFTYSMPNDSTLWFNKETRERNVGSLSNKPKQNDFNIIIVLESPHKEEYKTKSLHPAIGKTGDNLHKHFNHLLDLLNSNIQSGTICNVYLMNAIQYQCSLGFSTEVFRSEIFKDIWDNYDGRNNFLERLKNKNPNIILNLCTNPGSYKLQDMVQNAIISQYEKNNSVAVFTGSHPSCWNLRRYIYINGKKSPF